MQQDSATKLPAPIWLRPQLLLVDGLCQSIADTEPEPEPEPESESESEYESRSESEPRVGVSPVVHGIFVDAAGPPVNHGELNVTGQCHSAANVRQL